MSLKKHDSHAGLKSKESNAKSRRPGSAPLLRSHTQSDLAARAELLWATDDSDGSDVDGVASESPSRSSLKRTRRRLHARSSHALQSAYADDVAKCVPAGAPTPIAAVSKNPLKSSDARVPMMGYKMTIAMMQELTGFMKVRSLYCRVCGVQLSFYNLHV